MRYPWEDDYIKPKSWNRDPSVKGGHYDYQLDEQMMIKNIETSGGYQAKVTGDQGELKLSSVLKSLPNYYHVIDNILLKTTKGSTQIDHTIVSPFGMFIIETKNHKGMIFGDTCGQVWTQVLKNGHFRMYSPVLQNNGHMAHLSKQINVPLKYMQGAIVFTNEDANLENVVCPWCLNVDQLYHFILQYDTRIFTDKQMIEIIKRIDKVNIDSYINRQKHINFVNQQKARKGY